MANHYKDDLMKSYFEQFGSEYPDDYSMDPINASGNMGRLMEELLPTAFMNKPHKEEEMEVLFERFMRIHFPGLENDIIEKVNSNNNIYNMFKAVKLSAANAVSRTLSTKLGNFWEEIANLSSNVIAPEIEFKITLKGIDVVLKKNNNFYFTQMKTQKNTLTGSQLGRSIQELSVYNNSLFVACIDNNAKWTYGVVENRVAGRQFWDDCNISYDRLLNNIGKLVTAAELLLE